MALHKEVTWWFNTYKYMRYEEISPSCKQHHMESHVNFLDLKCYSQGGSEVLLLIICHLVSSRTASESQACREHPFYWKAAMIEITFFFLNLAQREQQFLSHGAVAYELLC